MPTGPDVTINGQSKIYIKQQPAGTTINGNTITTEVVEDVGSLTSQYGVQTFNGQILPGKIGFGIAPGAANHTVITITVQDNGGNPITGVPFDLDIILSDAATGVGLTATTPSGGFSITTGTLLNTYVASKAAYVQTDGNGVVVMNITDTAKTGFFVMVQAGQQPVPAVSRQLVTGDYG
jgi:hypothetical protein